jgi:hypothetical protein
MTMVDVRTETKTNHNSKPVNPRTAIREARQRRLRLVSAGKNETVKVYAATEMLRSVLRHPAHGTRFRQELDQPVEWPNDSFTKRRIADGSVRTDGPAQHRPELVQDETLNPRQHAVAVAGARVVVDNAKTTLRLASLSPNTAVAGSAADIVMACIGTGFTKETVIKFGDYDEPTTFVSATEVTTGVKPSLFINPDTVPVLVHTGSLSSEPLDFTFTEPAVKAKAPKPSAA